MMMKGNKFLKKYSMVKVKFSGYYKYVFIFEGVGSEGEEVTIHVGGDIDSIYRLDIDQNKEYLIGDFMYPPIVCASIETEEEEINVIFDEKGKEEEKMSEGSKEKGIDVGQEGEGFHVVFGTGPKNGMNGVIPGLRGCGEGVVLNLSGLNSLLVADLDYFVEHHEEVLRMVKEQIERRDYFREHPEELEEKMDEARKAK